MSRATARQIASRLHFAVWLLLLLALVAGGARQVGRSIGEESRAGRGPTATTDVWLRNLGISHSSGSVQALLTGGPPGNDLVVVGRDGDPFLIMTYYLASYLGWPHRVWAMSCRGPSAALITWPGEPRAPSLVIFYSSTGVPSPASPSALRLSPNMVVASGIGTADWTAYCSR